MEVPTIIRVTVIQFLVSISVAFSWGCGGSLDAHSLESTNFVGEWEITSTSTAFPLSVKMGKTAPKLIFKLPEQGFTFENVPDCVTAIMDECHTTSEVISGSWNIVTISPQSAFLMIKLMPGNLGREFEIVTPVRLRMYIGDPDMDKYIEFSKVEH